MPNALQRDTQRHKSVGVGHDAASTDFHRDATRVASSVKQASCPDDRRVTDAARATFQSDWTFVQGHRPPRAATVTMRGTLRPNRRARYDKHRVSDQRSRRLDGARA